MACDSDWNQGYSNCELVCSDRKTAIFRGNLSTKIVKAYYFLFFLFHSSFHFFTQFLKFQIVVKIWISGKKFYFEMNEKKI